MSVPQMPPAPAPAASTDISLAVGGELWGPQGHDAKHLPGQYRSWCPRCAAVPKPGSAASSDLSPLVASIRALHSERDGHCSECAATYPCATIELLPTPAEPT